MSIIDAGARPSACPFHTPTRRALTPAPSQQPTAQREVGHDDPDPVSISLAPSSCWRRLWRFW